MRTKLLDLINSISNSNDPTSIEEGTELVLEMVNACGEYVRVVAAMESERLCVSNFLEGEDLITRLGDMDDLRTDTHEQMMEIVAAVNELCEEIGCEYIYDGQDDRREYGDFAFEVARAFFEERV